MKKRVLFFLVLSTFFSLSVSAQNAFQDAVKKMETAPAVDSVRWKLTGITGVNLGQTALVNWVAGGANSFAVNAYLNGYLGYRENRWAWDNSLNLQFGNAYAEKGAPEWQKNADKISFTSILGYQISKQFYYSLLFDFNSQFAKGYNYPNTTDYISNFMAPAYSNIALGVSYIPNDEFSLLFSPIALHMTFVLDDPLSEIGAFGVDPGDKFKIEPGALLRASLKKTVMENVDLFSTLDMFTPYNDDFGNVDINWDVMLSFKINKILTATLNTTLRYFDREHYVNPEGVDKGPKVQFKETFGLGLAFNF